MMRLTLSVILFSIASVVAFAEPNVDPSSPRKAAVESFNRTNPGVSLDVDGSRIHQIYGAPFGLGADAEAVADDFRRSHAAMFGLRHTDLDPRSGLEDGRHTQPLGYDPKTGAYKFTLVLFSQSRDGVPVFRADLRLLVRNEPNSPLVMAASSLRDIGEFAPNIRAQVVSKEQLQNAAQQFDPRLVKFSEPRKVIWAGTEGIEAPPTLALEFVGNSADPASPNGYAEWLFVADAGTGTILFKEDQVITDVITGNVGGMATDGLPPGADLCRDENNRNMPYAQVSLSGGVGAVFADVNGNYALATPDSNPTTVESRLRGSRFIVQDQSAGGAVPLLSQSVTPPGPGNFQHNAANTSEFVRANVNAYLQSNIVRDFVLAAHPTYPTIATQINFPVLTNINLTCNAFYSPGAQSLNFYRSGGGCSNLAFSDVIHHEFGHHVVQMGGSGQGQYGEGMGDCMGVLISDQPLLGIGFQNNCSAGIRTAANTKTYPCAGEIHDCGQLISGCVWDTRNLLAATDPLNYRTILAGLTVNSVPLHTGTEITPAIFTTFLTLDDDDANINNGTPHCYEIIKGFGLHSMTQGALTVTTFQYPSGRPATTPTNTPVNVQVNVVPGTCPAVVSNSGTLYYRIGTSGPFTSVSMTETLANQYLATLPGAPCESVIQYYFSVARSPSGVIYDPPIPANAVYSLDVGLSYIVAYDFQANPGWTSSSTATDGQWDVNPGVPVNCGRGDPGADYDGSGNCWMTDNSAAASCNSDVDGGSTTLTSQIIDVTSFADPKVRYARWYSNNFGANPQTQVFTVEVSSNGGANWLPLETVGPTTGSPNPEVAGGWFVKTYRIADFVTPSNQFRIRFVAADNIGAVVEAAIDAFQIFDYVCPPPCPAPTGDINGDTLVDGADIGAFVAAMFGTPTFLQGCAGDFNLSSALDPGDVDGLVAVLLVP